MKQSDTYLRLPGFLNHSTRFRALTKTPVENSFFVKSAIFVMRGNFCREFGREKRLGLGEYALEQSYDGFVKNIKENILPDFINFQNDLGINSVGKMAPDGYSAAKWLVYESGLDLGNLKLYVHFANPVAAGQIRG